MDAVIEAIDDRSKAKRIANMLDYASGNPRRVLLTKGVLVTEAVGIALELCTPAKDKPAATDAKAEKIVLNATSRTLDKTWVRLNCTHGMKMNMAPKVEPWLLSLSPDKVTVAHDRVLGSLVHLRQHFSDTACEAIDNNLLPQFERIERTNDERDDLAGDAHSLLKLLVDVSRNPSLQIT